MIFDPCAQYRNFPLIADLDSAMSDGPEIFRVSESLESDPERAFSVTMETLDGGQWRWSDYTLIVDESSMLQRPQSMHPALARLIRQAPDDVCVIQTLHRPSETHPTVRALVTDCFFFQAHIARDLEVIEQTYGAEVAAKVSRLSQHHVLHWWLGAGGIPRYEVWDKPEEWFIELRNNSHV